VKKLVVAIAICLVFTACQTPEGGVMNKVLSDFGLKEKPEGYVSGADKVFPTLNSIGPEEMARLNAEERQGTVEFQEEGLKRKFYKQAKVYESFYPIEVAVGSGSERAYVGYIDYTYQMYQSPRKDTRVAAQNETASIPTGETGRERLRYNLSQNGNWDGAKGEKVKDK